MTLTPSMVELLGYWRGPRGGRRKHWTTTVPINTAEALLRRGLLRKRVSKWPSGFDKVEYTISDEGWDALSRASGRIA